MKKSSFLAALAAFIFCASLSCGFAASAADEGNSLSIQKLAFVEDVMGLGQYRPHTSNYSPAETCSVYVEAAGYSTPPVEDGQDQYSFSLAVDIVIKDSTGQALASQSDVDKQEGAANNSQPPGPQYLWFSFPMGGWPVGKFVLEVGVRDNLSGQTVSGDLPMSVEPDKEPDEVFETTGTLQSLEETGDGWLITLQVYGRQASALLAPSCQFYLNGTGVRREVFIEKAIDQEVTVEFHDDSDEVALCRARVEL